MKTKKKKKKGENVLSCVLYLCFKREREEEKTRGAFPASRDCAGA